jgi:hypothetical protein
MKKAFIITRHGTPLKQALIIIGVWLAGLAVGYVLGLHAFGHAIGFW